MSTKHNTSPIAHRNKVKEWWPSTLSEVHTIFGGLTCGDADHVREEHGRGLASGYEVFHNIHNRGKDKEPRMVREGMVFTVKEASWLLHPYYDALVITLLITINKIYWLLVITRSLVDILFKNAWKQMKLQHPLKSVNTPLYGFNEEPLTLDGSVKLLFIIREDHTTRTIMINFMVVDFPST